MIHYGLSLGSYAMQVEEGKCKTLLYMESNQVLVGVNYL